MKAPADWSEAKGKAKIFKALGHPARLYLVERLAERPRCVCEMVEMVPGRQATTSRHLGILVTSGILRRHREGTKMIYELAMPCLLSAMPCVMKALGGGRGGGGRRKAR